MENSFKPAENNENKQEIVAPLTKDDGRRGIVRKVFPEHLWAKIIDLWNRILGRSSVRRHVLFQSGRSMIEMLCVLFVIALLAVGAAWGLELLYVRNQRNNIEKEAIDQAADLASRRTVLFVDDDPDGEVEYSYTTKYNWSRKVESDAERGDILVLRMSGVPESVCAALIENRGEEKGVFYSVTAEDDKGVKLQNCKLDNNVVAFRSEVRTRIGGRIGGDGLPVCRSRKCKPNYVFNNNIDVCACECGLTNASCTGATPHFNEEDCECTCNQVCDSKHKPNATCDGCECKETPTKPGENYTFNETTCSWTCGLTCTGALKVPDASCENCVCSNASNPGCSASKPDFDQSDCSCKCNKDTAYCAANDPAHPIFDASTCSCKCDKGTSICAGNYPSTPIFRAEDCSCVCNWTCDNSEYYEVNGTCNGCVCRNGKTEASCTGATPDFHSEDCSCQCDLTDAECEAQGKERDAETCQCKEPACATVEIDGVCCSNEFFTSEAATGYAQCTSNAKTEVVVKNGACACECKEIANPYLSSGSTAGSSYSSTAYTSFSNATPPTCEWSCTAPSPRPLSIAASATFTNDVVNHFCGYKCIATDCPTNELFNSALGTCACYCPTNCTKIDNVGCCPNSTTPASCDTNQKLVMNNDGTCSCTCKDGYTLTSAGFCCPTPLPECNENQSLVLNSDGTCSRQCNLSTCSELKEPNSACTGCVCKSNAATICENQGKGFDSANCQCVTNSSPVSGCPTGEVCSIYGYTGTYKLINDECLCDVDGVMRAKSGSCTDNGPCPNTPATFCSFQQSGNECDKGPGRCSILLGTTTKVTRNGITSPWKYTSTHYSTGTGWSWWSAESWCAAQGGPNSRMVVANPDTLDCNPDSEDGDDPTSCKALNAALLKLKRSPFNTYWGNLQQWKTPHWLNAIPNSCNANSWGYYSGDETYVSGESPEDYADAYLTSVVAVPKYDKTGQRTTSGFDHFPSQKRINHILCTCPIDPTIDRCMVYNNDCTCAKSCPSTYTTCLESCYTALANSTEYFDFEACRFECTKNAAGNYVPFEKDANGVWRCGDCTNHEVSPYCVATDKNCNCIQCAIGYRLDENGNCTGCNNNNDCPYGYFCAFESARTCEDEDEDKGSGTCMLIADFGNEIKNAVLATSGDDSGTYPSWHRSTLAMTQWSAENWCEAQGLTYWNVYSDADDIGDIADLQSSNPAPAWNSGEYWGYAADCDAQTFNLENATFNTSVNRSEKRLAICYGGCETNADCSPGNFCYGSLSGWGNASITFSNGEYAAHLGDHTSYLKGRCRPVDSLDGIASKTINVQGYPSTWIGADHGLDWLSAQNWCAAQGKKMLSLEVLNCSDGGQMCPLSDTAKYCPGTAALFEALKANAGDNRVFGDIGSPGGWFWLKELALGYGSYTSGYAIGGYDGWNGQCPCKYNGSSCATTSSMAGYRVDSVFSIGSQYRPLCYDAEECPTIQNCLDYNADCSCRYYRCSGNDDCPTGQFCASYGPLDPVPYQECRRRLSEEGFCAPINDYNPISKTTNGHTWIYSSKGMPYWIVRGWCSAQGKRSATRADIGCGSAEDSACSAFDSFADGMLYDDTNGGWWLEEKEDPVPQYGTCCLVYTLGFDTECSWDDEGKPINCSSSAGIFDTNSDTYYQHALCY